MQTIVIGHKNPDMDSICSAIGCAELKRLGGWLDVVPARCGPTNPRIDFALDRFGIEPPVLLSDLSPRVSDVMQPNVVSVHVDTPIYDAIQLIDRRRLRGLPVVDDRHRCVGLLNAYKIMHHLFPPREEAGAARIVTSSLADIARTVGGQFICGELSTAEEELFLLVGAMRQDSFGPRLASYRDDGRKVVVFVGDRPHIQHLAIDLRAHAIVVTGAQAIEPEVEIAARTAGVTLISSPTDTATTVLMSRGAVRAGRMLETNFLSFRSDTRLAEARRAAADSSAFVFPVVDDHGKLCGILSKSDFIKEIPRQLILVDHNELDQAVRGADQVPILEIYDHHRLGGFTSTTPVHFWNNPVGSTSTIIALCFRHAGLAIPLKIAGILLSGLISDTLNLHSPTTTDTDRRMRDELAKAASVDPDAYAQELFSVGSPLLTLTAEEAINADSKPYTENGHRFVVAQVEELTFSHFHEKRDALLAALEARQKREGLLFAALLVTDITTQSSLLLVRGDDRFFSAILSPAA
ncbi:MAG TPA: putative manganese-dependent inorganic diphosphatase, partial [Bradyrhizobium sp.]|nr:putative manganese-dependent inorganic diphosphatase [Bradyrhizobium sp.]